MGYQATRHKGVYEITRKDGTVTGYSVVYKNEFNKTTREKAQNPEDDGPAKTEKQAAIFLLQKKDEVDRKRQSLQDGTDEMAITDKPLDTVAEIYFKLHQDRKNTNREKGRYHNHISGFIVRRKEVGGLTSSQLKPEDIDALQLHLENLMSAKSVNNVTNLLRTIIRFGIANDHFKTNPMRRYKPLQVDNEIERVFTPDEIQELIDKAIQPYDDELLEGNPFNGEIVYAYEPTYVKRRLQMFIRTMYYTAQRPESLLRLKKKDITDKGIKITAIKKQKQHYVPIADKFLPYLEDWTKDLQPEDYLFHTEGRPRQASDYEALRVLAQRLFEPLNNGLDFRKDRKQWASLYSLRHSAATIALRATSNEKLVQSMLNHSDPRVTARYAKLLDETKREGFNAL